MNEEYDVIVLGTGLKECVLSGLLAVKGKKVLHLDRNGYYGADTASLNLTNLWKTFRPNQEVPKQYGHNRDWNVDMIPKFIMADGKLVKMLLHTKVTRYLEWKCVDASYVAQYQKGGLFSSAKMAVAKIPTNQSEVLASNLMGLWEKKNMAQFLKFVMNVTDDPKTWNKYDLASMPMKELYKKYGVGEATIDFVGHALALHHNDAYMEEPALPTVQKINLYLESHGRYGDSPFLYPLYGIGGLPEAFSRLCAIHGGTYMLNTPVDEITMADGKVTGIRSGENTATAPLVICDPSYAPNANLKPVGKVIRAICLMDHTIPNTGDAPSIQLIIPSKQTGRHNDIYVSMISNSHLICAKGYFVAMVSTMVESDQPEQEIDAAMKLLGPVLDMFVSVSTVYEPFEDGKNSGLWISKSYDPSSHFEEASVDILQIYEKLTGEKLDLNIEPDEDEDY